MASDDRRAIAGQADAERAIESLRSYGNYEMSIEGYLDPVY